MNMCYFHHFPQHIYFIYRDESRTTPNLYLIQLSFTYIITSNNAVVASKRTMMLRQSTATTHCNMSQSFLFTV